MEAEPGIDRQLRVRPVTWVSSCWVQRALSSLCWISLGTGQPRPLVRLTAMASEVEAKTGVFPKRFPV